MGKLYQRAIIVFLDFLGFRDKIQESEINSSEIQHIRDVLYKAKEIGGRVEEIKNQNRLAFKEIQVRMFSDSIVVSCLKLSDASFHEMVQLVMFVQTLVLIDGFFLRGAIVVGDHYEDEDVTFGPAIIRGYDIERQAIWPRVVIDSSALNELSQEYLSDAYGTYLLVDSDGSVYLDYLTDAFVLYTFLERKGERSYFKTAETVFLKRKESILEAVNRENIKSNSKILTKYHAVASYHNWVIDNLCSFLSHFSEANPKKYERIKRNTKVEGLYRNLYTQMSMWERPQEEDPTLYEKKLVLATDQLIEEMSQKREVLESYKIDVATIFQQLYVGINAVHAVSSQRILRYDYAQARWKLI